MVYEGPNSHAEMSGKNPELENISEVGQKTLGVNTIKLQCTDQLHSKA
jgi:hypothetical protein